MDSIDILASKIQSLTNESNSRKPKPYDPVAVVRRVEGDTVWVHIPGGVEETPVKKTTTAKPGETVRVHVENGAAWLIGNSTNPPTDDSRANQAYQVGADAGLLAGQAIEDARIASEKAAEATASAEIANEAATRAQADATTAKVSAGEAKTAANEAKADATTAKESADQAKTQAGEAKTAADEAKTDASTAKTQAGQATTAANEAKTQAGEAKTSAEQAKKDASDAHKAANNALTELSTVEDVVGTVTWAAEHSGQDMADYINSHLALTTYGLDLVLDNTSYRIHIGTHTADGDDGDDGVYVIDDEGHVVSFFGEDIRFDSGHAQYIGNPNAYIAFDPTGNGGQGSLIIGGSSIQMGNRTLDDVLGKTLIYDHTYEYVRDSNNKPVSANFTAFLYRGGVDVKAEYPTENFTWYLKKEEKGTGEVTETLIATGYTCSVNLSDCGYGAEVIGKFTLIDDADALTESGDNLTNAENENLSVRATGESIRVRDLTTSTTIFPTDKLMVVGNEDEHLVGIETLQDYLNAHLDKQVLFDTTANWNSQLSLISKADTIYIYTDYKTDSQGKNVAGIKVGDGLAYLIDLPFTDAIATEHIEDNTRHITQAERDSWNNKVRCYYAGTEQLIFTTA